MIHSGRRGILLIGHGTRSEAGAAECFLLAQRLRDALPAAAVEVGFLELRPPSIAQAWQRLIDGQATQIDAVPLLLFAAGHAKRDIPAALAACAERSGQVRLRLTQPLSRQPSLIALAAARAVEGARAAEVCEAERATAAARAEASGGPRTALVVVGRGNHDPCAQTEFRLFVATLDRAIRPALPLATVEGAFYAMAEPRLPDVLQRVVQAAAIDAVIVLPLLLFTGQVKEAIARQVDQAAHKHRSVPFQLTEHLGADPLLVQAVLARIEELSPTASSCCFT